MLEDFGLSESLKVIVYLMISFSFFVGIMLVVSQEAFVHFDKALQREYGIRKRFLPKLEETQFKFVDWVLLKYRTLSGLLIAVIAFMLLLTYK
ncbi:MAG: hypothetical protein Q8Q08_10110 [Candidatus Omnitrophota bacterium]|nr:hypothetical protein [Candidatus Omnitrophota bacterium]